MPPAAGRAPRARSRSPRATPAVDPADRSGPGLVAGPADLGPVAGSASGHQRSSQARSAGSGGGPGDSAPSGVDEHQPGAVRGLLDHVERDVVQPLVGDQQPGHQWQVGDVPDAVTPGPTSGRDLDREQPQPVPVRPVRGRAPRPAARPGRRRRRPGRAGRAGRAPRPPGPAGADGLGEQRRGVHRGAEVARPAPRRGRRSRPAPYSGGGPRLPPPHGHAPQPRARLTAAGAASRETRPGRPGQRRSQSGSRTRGFTLTATGTPLEDWIAHERTAARPLADRRRHRHRPGRQRPRRRPGRRRAPRRRRLRRLRRLPSTAPTGCCPGCRCCRADEVVAAAELRAARRARRRARPLVAGLAATGACAPASSSCTPPARTASRCSTRPPRAGALPLALHPAMTFTGTPDGPRPARRLLASASPRPTRCGRSPRRWSSRWAASR